MKKHTYLAGISLYEIDSEDGLDDDELERALGKETEAEEEKKSAD